MKYSQEYYQNRRLLKKLKYDSVKYYPTIKETWKWFHILNQQVFGNLLNPVDKIFLSNHKKYGDVYALYHYGIKDGHKTSKISVCKSFDDEKVFVEILAHEMIHHFQYSYNEPLGHGPSFSAWSDNFNVKGLKLYRAK
jgi:hypothetical protein